MKKNKEAEGMGKYMSVIVGAVVALVGLSLLGAWWNDMVLVMKGTIPAALVFCGVIAVIAGISEIKDEQDAKSKKKV